MKESKSLIKLYDELQEQKTSAHAANSEGFTRWIDEFINPTFTTSDFENARTVNREHFEIEKMHYMSGERGCPTMAIGKVIPKDDQIAVRVWWDQDGKCRNISANERRPDWDLVRPDQQHIDAQKIVSSNAIVGMIVIIICCIF